MHLGFRYYILLPILGTPYLPSDALIKIKWSLRWNTRERSSVIKWNFCSSSPSPKLNPLKAQTCTHLSCAIHRTPTTCKSHVAVISIVTTRSGHCPQFEEYREAVKLKASKLPKKHVLAQEVLFQFQNSWMTWHIFPVSCDQVATSTV